MVGLGDEKAEIVGVGHEQSVCEEDLAVFVGGEPWVGMGVGGVELVTGGWGCWCRRVGVKALVDLFVNDCRIKNEVSE